VEQTSPWSSFPSEFPIGEQRPSYIMVWFASATSELLVLAEVGVREFRERVSAWSQPGPRVIHQANPAHQVPVLFYAPPHPRLFSHCRHPFR
jgi:hypothetical protein